MSIPHRRIDNLPGAQLPPDQRPFVSDDTHRFREVRDIEASMKQSEQQVRRECAEHLTRLREAVAKTYPASADQVTAVALQVTAAFGVAPGNPYPSVQLISQEFSRGVLHTREEDFAFPYLVDPETGEIIEFFDDPKLADEIGITICEMGVTMHHIIGEALRKNGKNFPAQELTVTDVMGSLKSILRVANREAIAKTKN